MRTANLRNTLAAVVAATLALGVADVTIDVGADGVRVGLASGPRLARADRHELSLGSTARWMPSSSVDAVTDGNMGAFSLSGARTVRWLTIPGVELLAEGGFEVGSFGGESFQRIETDASVLLFSAGLRARRSLTPRLALGARAHLGLARVGLTLSDSFADTQAIADSDWTPAAYLGAGIDFTPFRTAHPDGTTRFAMGFRAELGYLAIAPVDVSGAPDRMDEDDVIRIPSDQAGLGALDPSALSLRFALVAKF